MKELKTGFWSRYFVLFFLSVFLIRCFLIDVMLVKGSSMKGLYDDGDMVLITKICDVEMIKRYDVVIIKRDDVLFDRYFVKRVIGLPGESIQIRDGIIFINGNPLDDMADKVEYSGIASSELYLGEDGFFLLGDNSSESQDSRYEWFGIVKASQIVAKPICVVWG